MQEDQYLFQVPETIEENLTQIYSFNLQTTFPSFNCKKLFASHCYISLKQFNALLDARFLSILTGK